ncbi:MAG: DNA primase, partial [Yoonia sp.]
VVMGAVADQIVYEVLENLMRNPHLQLTPAIRKAGDEEIAAQSLTEELGKLMSRRGHLRELSDGMDDMAGLADEGLTWRLSRAAASVDTTIRQDNDDSAEYDKGDNGALMKKAERSAFDDLVARIGLGKDDNQPKS